jgi:hypothetical protein
VTVVFPARRAQAGVPFAAIRSPRTGAAGTVSGCVAERLCVVAPLAAAVPFTRSLPEPSATVIVGVTGRRRRKQTRRNKQGYTTTRRPRFGTWRFCYGTPRAVWERVCLLLHWSWAIGSFDFPRGL